MMAVSVGVASADTTTPTYQPGQIVDVYTFDWSSETTGFSISLDSMVNHQFSTVPATLVNQTSLGDGGYSDELQFTMPNLGSSGDSGASALVMTGTGGALVTRTSVVQPPISSGYGLTFTYDPAPVGALPEVPFAALMPLSLLLVGFAAYLWRRRSTSLSS